MSFTEDIFGSFVEIINMLLLMRLFSQEYFKYKVKLIVAIISISVIISLVDLLNMPSITLLNYAIVIVILRCAVKRSIVHVLFEGVFTLAFTTIIEYILAMIFYELQGMQSLEFSNRCIQLFIVFIICLTMGLNRQLSKKVQFYYQKYHEEIYFIGATLFSFSTIELMLWKSNNEVVFHQSAIISLYTAIWFSLCLYLLKKLIENRRQKENIRLHEQYMETTENLLNGLYSEKHDFNKHLQAIQSLCQFEESSVAVAEIEMYIDELKTKELNKKKSTVSINTGNGVVNALLYSKTKEAEKRGVQFYYVPSGIFPEFPCEQYELVQILGNLLDNAFEYVDGLEMKQRKVILSISEIEDHKQIEVRNTYYVEKSEQVSISQNKNCSTKSGERRGYGLQNVKAIILKYHGKFNLFQEENEFVVEILF